MRAAPVHVHLLFYFYLTTATLNFTTARVERALHCRALLLCAYALLDYYFNAASGAGGVAAPAPLFPASLQVCV
jgi:hypothetical protein